MGDDRPEAAYLDYNATTPVAEPVIEVINHALRTGWGNPSSGHALGRAAKELLERARCQVAGLVGCEPGEIVFTSGGTESNNMVLLGLAEGAGPPKRRIVTTQIEHPCILNPCLHLLEKGWDVQFVRVEKSGVVDLDALEKAVDEKTLLVSVMLANNETGVIQPVEEVAAIARRKGALVHTDAAQAAGKIPVDVARLGVDYLSMAGHKLYAPKGIGALYIKKGSPMGQIMYGAGQQGGLRPGTEPVPLAAALGEACRLAGEEMEKEAVRLAGLREELFQGLCSLGVEVVRHGLPERTLPNTLYVSFPGFAGASLLERAPGLMASTASACHDRSVSISHVLASMGVNREVALGAVRFSLGRLTTREEISFAVQAMGSAARHLLQDG